MTNPLDTIATTEPLRLVSGDTWTWKRSDLSADYPTAAYSLSYTARREGDATTVKIIPATESGGDYVATVSHTDSAGYVAGVWHWEAYMTRTSDGARVRVASGQWTVEPNGATASDPRSHAVKVLAALESIIEGRATQDVNSYSIAGRSLTKMSPAELRDWREHYRREVNRERAAERASKGMPTGRTTVVRFRS